MAPVPQRRILRLDFCHHEHALGSGASRLPTTEYHPNTVPPLCPRLLPPITALADLSRSLMVAGCVAHQCDVLRQTELSLSAAEVQAFGAQGGLSSPPTLLPDPKWCAACLRLEEEVGPRAL